MSLLQAVTLGAVQGLTEFVPISSSGHLVLVPEALGWPEPGLAFDVLLHTASLVALLAYFRHELVELARGVVTGNTGMRRLAMLLAIGTIPAAVAGVALGDYFEESFEDPPAAAVQLVITAVILVAGERTLARRAAQPDRLREMNDLTTTDATIIGTAQAVAILPGISRSGATIAAALGLSVAREDAARFSFLLAIPALFGAALVQLPDLGDVSLGTGSGVAGFAASLVTSYAAIWGLIRYLRTRTLYPFAVYCVVAGVIFYLLVADL